MALYESIPVSGSWIRILRLLPSPGPVRCKLFAASLDQPPPFTALSYTWGDSSKTESIKVNGHSMVVTQNLFNALLSLQQQEPRLLWIDQLCIDQNSNADKEKQIPLMRDIYSRAAETVAWLGAETASSDRAMDFLDEAGKYGNLLGINYLNIIHEDILQLQITYPYPPFQAYPAENSDSLRLRMDEIIKRWGEWQDMDVVDDTIKLFKSAYFTRGWVKQEVAIPPVLTLRCGSKTLDIETFKAGFVVFQSHYHYSAMRISAMDAALLGTEKALTKTQRDELSKRLHFEDDSSSLIHPTLRTRDLYQSGLKQDELTLERLLRRFGRHVKFTNGRDGIYGFGGLASDYGRLGLHDAVSFSRPWEQVHTLAMRRVINNQGVHMLEHVQYPKSSDQLPSWVPDFPCKGHPTLTEVTISSTKPFSAGIGTQDVPSTAPRLAGIDWEDKTLRSSGWIIDTIAKVGRKWGEGTDTPERPIPTSIGAVPIYEDITAFCIESAHIQTLNADFAIYTCEQWKAGAVWRIPVLDHERFGFGQTSRRATQQSARGYEGVKNLLTWSESKNIPEMKQNLEAIRLSLSRLVLSAEGGIYFSSLSELEDRKPFLTEKGYVGVGPLHMRPSDVVCILAGARVPFILRRLEQNTALVGPYTLVGEAYCDGVMDGEVFDLGISEMEVILI